jgi:hypothetical protein
MVVMSVSVDFISDDLNVVRQLCTVNNNVELFQKINYIPRMRAKQKSPLGIRMKPDARKALENAAKSDGRATANLANKIITDWLLDNKLL